MTFNTFEEGKWKSNISPTQKTNLLARLNCPTRIYIHILKDVGCFASFTSVLFKSSRDAKTTQVVKHICMLYN
ncbi:hypothetical protein Ahy_A08g040342 [Arachis hypogaea]|uniref:Uncharacterized protein n=1 Tax=Arachis hypogaea TaxID=3818 RepID=A0A445BZM6_ARAHY|nr:hypothetical protein Ahy_A08g040342 [Arachis hypogaea]